MSEKRRVLTRTAPSEAATPSSVSASRFSPAVSRARLVNNNASPVASTSASINGSHGSSSLSTPTAGAATPTARGYGQPGAAAASSTSPVARLPITTTPIGAVRARVLGINGSSNVSLPSKVFIASPHHNPPAGSPVVGCRTPPVTSHSPWSASAGVGARTRGASAESPSTESPTVRVRAPHASAGPTTGSPRLHAFPLSDSGGDGDQRQPSRPTLVRSIRTDPVKSATRPPAAGALLPSASISPSNLSRSIFASAAPTTSAVAARRPASPTRLPISSSRPSSPIRRPLSPVRPATPNTNNVALNVSSRETRPQSPSRPPHVRSPILTATPSSPIAIKACVPPNPPLALSCNSTSHNPSAQTQTPPNASTRLTFDPSKTISSRPTALSHHRSNSLASSISSVSIGGKRKTMEPTAAVPPSPSTPQSVVIPATSSSPIKAVLPEVAAYVKIQADAKVNRKILDLEITNASLLAINAALEMGKAKQAQEMRDLRQAVRNRSLATTSSSTSSGLLSPHSDASSWAGKWSSTVTSDSDVDEDDLTWEELLSRDECFADIVRTLDSLNRKAREALDRTITMDQVGIGAKVINQFHVPPPAATPPDISCSVDSEMYNTCSDNEPAETSLDISLLMSSVNHSRATSIGID